MTDDFESEFRDSLRRAVPTPPDTPTRADGARAYSRRVRRVRGACAVGVVAVVAAAVISVPSLMATSESHLAGPGNPTSDTPPQGGPACPTARHVGRMDGAAVVPADAVAARLCVVEPGGSVWSPHEPLTTGLGNLAQTLHALPVMGLPTCIPANGTKPRYTLIFESARGDRSLVEGDLNCGTVYFEHSVHDGAEEVLRAYLDAISAQRQKFEAPSPGPPTEACLEGTGQGLGDHFLVDGTALSLRIADVCVRSSHPGGQLMQSGTLTPAQIETLNADFALHRSRSLPTDQRVTSCLSAGGDETPTYTILGTSTWGDVVQLTGTCLLFSYTDRQGHWYWAPSPRVATMLEEAVLPRSRVTGRLLGVGGPPGATPSTWAGTITLRSEQATYHAEAGDDGRFEVAVAPGRYRITGRSPSFDGGQAGCNPLRPFITLRPGRTARVDVLCQMK